MRSEILIGFALTSLALSAAAEPTVAQFNTTEVELVLGGTGATPDQLLLSYYLSDHGGGSRSGYLYTTATLSTHNPWEAPFEIDNVAITNGSILNDSTGWAFPFDWNSGESLTAWLAWAQDPNECANRSTIVFFDGDPSTSEQNSIPTGVYYTGFRWIGDDEATRYGWIAYSFERMPYSGTRWEDKWSGCEYMFYDELKEPIFRFIAAGWETEPDTAITVGGGMCRGDFNFDATVDFFDVSDFVQAWADQDQSADINLDGSINFFDISDFLTRYQEECDL